MDATVYFSNISVGAVDYQWNFGDNSAYSISENSEHNFPEEIGGSYLVELVAYSPLGCVDTAWTTISVREELIYYMPNSFTPDGDAYNEYFKPVFTSGYDPYDFTMLIFNRWGEVIWESHDASVGWDGTYGGRVIQDGVYSWTIEFKTSANDERMTISGHVNLLR
jgi:gliding motility-associated-like protein